jgi:branched-chain amino acid transport system permease protein
LISLGHAFFFGVGGYTTALVFKFFNLPIWISIPAALAMGVLFSIIIGIPCLRVKGPYLALVTLAFPLIADELVKWTQLDHIFGSEIGILNIPTFFPFLERLARVQAEYYLTLVLLLISGIIIYKIANSKTGIVFISILDDEVGTKACGINVTRYKLIAFMIGGLFATLAGCIQVHLFPTGANHLLFSLYNSLLPLIVTFLGGIGTIYGAIVGSYVYVLLDRYIMENVLPQIFRLLHISVGDVGLSSVKISIFALIVLIIVIRWPRGLATFTTDKLEDLEEARDLDERGPRIWKRYKKKGSEQ